jgi:peptide/nickel transport system permease protein
MDTRLSAESVRRVREGAGQGRDLWSFYAGYAKGLVRGDLGTSQALGQPVGKLLRERAPVTLSTAGVGLLAAWIAALALAMLCALWRAGPMTLACGAFSSTLLCLPASAIGLLVVLVSTQSGHTAMVTAAIALVVFPRLFQLTHSILSEAMARPHVDCAVLRGVSRARMVVWHVLAPSAAPLLALAGVSTTLAFSAAIPIEVVCDSPGLGQLAWQAAMQRDFPLLVNLSLIVCLLAAGSNALSEGVAACIGKESAERGSGP